MKRILLSVSLSLSLFSLLKGQGADIAGQINNRFTEFHRSYPREEIFIHSDREEYIAGEDIWFNVYLIDRQTLKPSSHSNIAYFEILNSENRPVVQKRIRIEDGFGPGQGVIPDTLSSGVYTIRAYTAWMKNFMPENSFSSDIKIYNALKNTSFREKRLSSEKLLLSSGSGSVLGTSSLRVSMQANNERPDNLIIRISSDDSWRKENNNSFFLLIQTHGVINYLHQESVNEQRADIAIPKTLLMPGINQVVLLNAKGQLVSEKYIYTPGADASKAELSSLEQSYDQRSKVSFELDFSKMSSEPEGLSNLSVSVAPLTGSKNLPELSDYLVFGSEYGAAPWHFLRGRKLSDLDRSSIDSLLSYLSSRWIDWRKLMSGVNPDIVWQAEENDHIVNGRLLQNSGPGVEAGEYVTLSKPGKTATFQYGVSDAEGNFNLRIPINESLQDLIIQPSQLNKSRKVILSSSFADKYPERETFTDSVGEAVPEHIKGWSVNYQVSKIYESKAVGAPMHEIIQSPPPLRFYGKPDQELVLDDYIKLPVMDEVFFELIVGAFLKKKKTGYEITVSNPVDNRIYEMPPVIMVDGIIINDASIIGNIDPDFVEKVDLIRERYFVGNYIFYGIVNVITRKGDFDGFPLNQNAIRVPYRVIEPVWSFASPDYSLPSVRNNRIPDFRNTLYWNPAVRPGNDGKAKVQFWTADVKADYVITVQGITSDGKPVSIRKTISVK